MQTFTVFKIQRTLVILWMAKRGAKGNPDISSVPVLGSPEGSKHWAPAHLTHKHPEILQVQHLSQRLPGALVENDLQKSVGGGKPQSTSAAVRRS